MPRKPIKAKKRKEPIPEWIDVFFETGQLPEPGDEFALAGFLFSGDDAAVRRTWEAEKTRIMTGWIRKSPGLRPWGFWKFDATDQRRKVAGSGVELTVHLPALKQQYRFGIPVHWDFDETDAPLFESQASYLDRHGLLTSAERRRLGPDDFEPVSMTEIQTKINI